MSTNSDNKMNHIHLYYSNISEYSPQVPQITAESCRRTEAANSFLLLALILPIRNYVVGIEIVDVKLRAVVTLRPVVPYYKRVVISPCVHRRGDLGDVFYKLLLS